MCELVRGPGQSWLAVGEEWLKGREDRHTTTSYCANHLHV